MSSDEGEETAERLTRNLGSAGPKRAASAPWTPGHSIAPGHLSPEHQSRKHERVNNHQCASQPATLSDLFHAVCPSLDVDGMPRHRHDH